MNKKPIVRKATKTDAKSVRFNLTFWQKLTEKHGIKTGNDAIIFFEKLYDQSFCPIVGVPTYDRHVAENTQNVEKIPDLDLNKLLTPAQKKAVKVVVQDQKGNELSDFMKRRQQSKLGNK